MTGRGLEVSLLTGGLPKGKSGEYGAVGEGYIPTFAGGFTLLRPRTGALRGVEMSLLTSAATRSGWMFWAGFGAQGISYEQNWLEAGAAGRRRRIWIGRFSRR